ncbi:hypothetical protein SAMN04488511_101135 [Pedobacter suwonensis]|uniref:Uncharacterized protein n=1 Tax=Pedobacter suwonensis TaxID=332999 RepID=A0A1I0SF71_9SPHI|nr:hypothetical protein SAMN04488511_101135 [Pedobacter suwonensis]
MVLSVEFRRVLRILEWTRVSDSVLLLSYKLSSILKSVGDSALNATDSMVRRRVQKGSTDFGMDKSL